MTWAMNYMTDITQSQKDDIRYIETPKYLYPLAEELAFLDLEISVASFYKAIISLLKYLIKYHKSESAADFYDALRRSTHEQHLLGNYYKRFKYIIRERMHKSLLKSGYYLEYGQRNLMADIIIKYFCENKLSDRLILENVDEWGST